MKVEIKELKNSQVELTIEVADKVIKENRSKVIQKLSESKKIDGFRKGHVPEDVIVEQFGEKMIAVEAMDMAIQDSYLEAINSKKIKALDMPKVEIISSTPLKFKATADVLPEFSVPALKDISVPKAKKISIKKEEIEETKKALCEKFAELKKQDRKAKKGDLVEIDFNGFDKDGVELEGTASKHHPVEVGSNTFIPGFEEELIGLKAGEEKSFEITFPKDYGKKEFQSKKVRFDVKVHDVFEKEIPAFDEALIEKLVGQKKSIKDMEKEIEGSLVEKYAREDMKIRENGFIENLAKKCKIDLPKSLVEQEVDNMIEHMKGELVQAQTTWENHLKHLSKTEEEMRKEITKIAEKNAHARLAFQSLLRENKPEVAEKDIEMSINQIMIKVPADQKKQAEAHFSRNGDGWAEVEFELIVKKFFEGILG